MVNKLIVAFDFTHLTEADALLEQLNPDHCTIKIGSVMFTRYGPQWVEQVIAKGFQVFLDLKFHDIPNTVARLLSPPQRWAFGCLMCTHLVGLK